MRSGSNINTNFNKNIMKKSEEISKEIFYKPATNGQAKKSIKEGAELIDNYVKEQLRIGGVGSAFYCQRDIEGDSICNSQCEHCNEYYKPLEQ